MPELEIILTNEQGLSHQLSLPISPLAIYKQQSETKTDLKQIQERTYKNPNQLNFFNYYQLRLSIN
jgi:hypothetical protein